MAPAASRLRAGAGLRALLRRALVQYLRLLRLYPVLTKATTRSAGAAAEVGGRGGCPELGRPREWGCRRRAAPTGRRAPRGRVLNGGSRIARCPACSSPPTGGRSPMACAGPGLQRRSPRGGLCALSWS